MRWKNQWSALGNILAEVSQDHYPGVWVEVLKYVLS